MAAAEAGIALAMVLMLCQQSGNLDIASWQQSREDCLPAYVDQEIPEETVATPEEWPSLTPAGVRPQTDPEEEWYRTRV